MNRLPLLALSMASGLVSIFGIFTVLALTLRGITVWPAAYLVAAAFGVSAVLLWRRFTVAQDAWVRAQRANGLYRDADAARAPRLGPALYWRRAAIWVSASWGIAIVVVIVANVLNSNDVVSEIVVEAALGIMGLLALTTMAFVFSVLLETLSGYTTLPYTLREVAVRDACTLKLLRSELEAPIRSKAELRLRRASGQAAQQSMGSSVDSDLTE